MIKFERTFYIAANVKTVWEVLTVPELVLSWNSDIEKLLDDSAGYPTVGKTYRWRFYLGPFPMILYDTTELVKAPSIFAMHGRMMRYLNWQERYTLREHEQGVNVDLTISMGFDMPILGKFLERTLMKSIMDKRVKVTQTAFTQQCEKGNNS